jgi:hypothetical protein
MCGAYHIFGEGIRQSKNYCENSDKTSFLFIITFIFLEIFFTLMALIILEIHTLQVLPVILIAGISIYISHKIDTIFYSQDL